MLHISVGIGHAGEISAHLACAKHQYRWENEDYVRSDAYQGEVRELLVLVGRGCGCLQGVGRRYANLVCKKADVDMNKRAGELNDEEVRLRGR